MTATTAEAPEVTEPTALQALAAIAQLLAQLLAQLPRAITAAVTQAGAQAQPQQRLCPACIVARMNWEHANKEAVTAAVARAEAAIREAAAAGQQPAVTLEQFLPPALAATVPPVNPAVTTVQGTDCCAGHIPGAPGQSRLLIAQGALSMAGITALAGR